jgi:hypothetical protein
MCGLPHSHGHRQILGPETDFLYSIFIYKHFHLKIKGIQLCEKNYLLYQKLGAFVLNIALSRCQQGADCVHCYATLK